MNLRSIEFTKMLDVELPKQRLRLVELIATMPDMILTGALIELTHQGLEYHQRDTNPEESNAANASILMLAVDIAIVALMEVLVTRVKANNLI